MLGLVRIRGRISLSIPHNAGMLIASKTQACLISPLAFIGRYAVKKQSIITWKAFSGFVHLLIFKMSQV